MKEILLKGKRRKILIAIAVVIVIGILLYSIIEIVEATHKEEISTSSVEENIEEIDNEEVIQEITEEEINIDELEEYMEENTEEDSEYSSSALSDSNSKTVSDKKYYIKVNYGANVVTIYTKDESGNYTVPVKAMICSTGTATPKSGVYAIKGRWEWLGLFGGVYGHYSTQIVGNILFHSVPYLEKGNPGSLEYWEYDKLGTSASMGCIRLTVKDAKWIYNNISKGTLVEFYSSSDPGPLGKPSAQKISSNTTCRNWDPTDSDSNNPWHTYKESSNNTTTNTTNTGSTNNTENATITNNTNTNNTSTNNNSNTSNKNTTSTNNVNTNSSSTNVNTTNNSSENNTTNKNTTDNNTTQASNNTVENKNNNINTNN